MGAGPRAEAGATTAEAQPLVSFPRALIGTCASTLQPPPAEEHGDFLQSASEGCGTEVAGGGRTGGCQECAPPPKDAGRGCAALGDSGGDRSPLGPSTDCTSGLDVGGTTWSFGWVGGTLPGGGRQECAGDACCETWEGERAGCRA